MKYFLKSLFAFAAITLVFSQCRKDEFELNGSSSKADFSFVVRPIQDTLPYAYQVTFTNSSEEANFYQWDFGDQTALSSEKNPVHTYAVGGEYIVKLTTVGTNGSNTIAKRVFVTSACQNAFFQNLTGCGENFFWTWNTDADAIKVLSPDGNTILFVGSAANCQVDDTYNFKANGGFAYDANGQTFDVQSGYSCQAPKQNANKYSVVAKAGQLPQIILGPLASGSGKPFIGTTDIVDNNRYTVQSYTSNTMVLRATLTGTGGNLIEIKLKKVEVLTLADIKNLLTGVVSKSWKLDATPGANAIIVGTEANPAEYFAGGELDATCQTDDIYTFKANDKITYNANGATFNGGNVAPNYNCGADRSYTDVPFTFSATTGGVSGLGSIKLPPMPPTIFIGTTDVPSENLYRIISISATKMTLRAGNGTSTVFQFKFIAI